MSFGAAPVVPGILGWVLLLVAATYAYRMLEVLNGRRDPGPVTVEDVTGDVGGDKTEETTEQLTARLRHAVLSNLPEPGTVPNATSSNPVTDLLGTDPIKNPIVSAAITFIRTVGFPPRGYVLRASLATRQNPQRQPGTVAPAEGHVAHIRVHDARTSRSVWTTMQEAPTRGEALEQAGFAAAAWMLCQARSVPPWLQFSSESEAAKAFREYQVSKSATDQKAITALTSAVRRDPTSGAALVQLGYAHDLVGQSVNALECYERAVAMFPDYRIAQYRAAIGWSALYVAGGIDEQAKYRLESLTKIGSKTNRQRTTLAGMCKHGKHPPHPDTWLCFVLDMARRRFRNAGDHSPVWWLSDLSVRLLSVYERPVLPRLGQRWSIYLAVRAASLPTRARQKDNDVKLSRRTKQVGKGHASRGSVRQSVNSDDRRLSRLDGWAHRRKAHWQMRYNLACAYSARYSLGQGPQREEKTRAVDLLRDALLHPDAQELTRAWLQEDPDLQPLQGDPRFNALLNWAATKEEITKEEE